MFSLAILRQKLATPGINFVRLYLVPKEAEFNVE